MNRFVDKVVVDAPPAEVFAWYSGVKNLERMIPPAMNMSVVKAQVPLRHGSKIRFGLRPKGLIPIKLPFEVKWDAVIDEWDEGVVFRDRQLDGPMEHWTHRHEFRELPDGRTEICDTIECGSPRNWFGRVFETFMVQQGIRFLFDHRRQIIEQSFPARSTA